MFKKYIVIGVLLLGNLMAINAEKVSTKTVTKMLTAEESQNSVIYMYLPMRTYGVVAFSGSDKAVGEVCSCGSGADIKADGKVVTFYPKKDKGEVDTLHIWTESGKCHSIVIVSLGTAEEAKGQKVTAKVVIK